jgi:deoxycytidylate deaminase
MATTTGTNGRRWKQAMDEAIELAKTSTMESMHAAVIVSTNPKLRNPIVSTGVNEHVKHLEHRKVFSIHAEMKALSNLIAIRGHNDQFFNNLCVLVARVGPETQGYPVRMSKPCLKCQKLLKKMGIRRIFYTVDENTICELLSWD